MNTCVMFYLNLYYYEMPFKAFKYGKRQGQTEGLKGDHKQSLFTQVMPLGGHVCFIR